MLISLSAEAEMLGRQLRCKFIAVAGELQLCNSRGNRGFAHPVAKVDGRSYDMRHALYICQLVDAQVGAI